MLCLGIVWVLILVLLEDWFVLKKVGFLICDLCVIECKKYGLKKVCKVF